MAYMEPREYIEAIREAMLRNDLEKVSELEARFGDQEVKLRDLEDTFAEVMSIVMSAIIGKDLTDTLKYDTLVNVLIDKEIISEDEEAEMRENVEREVTEIEKEIEGEG